MSYLHYNYVILPKIEILSITKHFVMLQFFLTNNVSTVVGEKQ